MKLENDFTQVPNSIFKHQKLSLRAMGLYAYLKFINYSGNALAYRPSQIQIMKAVGIGSRNTFKKILNELIENGFVVYYKGNNLIAENSTYKLKNPKAVN